MVGFPAIQFNNFFLSVFIHQINFQQKGNVQSKKIPKAITVWLPLC